jgi:hypothetical protein
MRIVFNFTNNISLLYISIAQILRSTTLVVTTYVRQAHNVDSMYLKEKYVWGVTGTL